MYSIKLINVHFWLATIGVVLYIVAMWISGVMQGLMWRAVNDDGTLTYSFAEAVEASIQLVEPLAAAKRQQLQLKALSDVPEIEADPQRRPR